MASTISGINSALVDDRVIPALRELKPALESFSYRVEAQGRILNDSIWVPIATDPTVATKTPGTKATATGTAAGMQVTLDTPVVAAWDAIEGQIAGRLFENYWADKAVGAIHQLGKSVINGALSIVTATNFGNGEGTDKLTVALADFGVSDLAALWGYAQTKIKNQRMSYGMNVGVAASIFGESHIGTMFSNTGTNFIATGTVPQLLGMNTWMYSAFPNNSQGLASAIFGRAAILIGIAPPEPLWETGGDVVEKRIIVDPETGIAALYTVYAHGGGTINGEMWLFYGVKKGQDAIVRHVIN